jgi:uncharacterized protein (DUF58 family)
VIRFEGVAIGCPDPFGLFRTLSPIRLPQNLTVLPRRYPVPPLALPGTMKYQHGGMALASSVGESEEFVSLRDYRHGDPVRHIDWRSWARTGKPIVKEFEDEFYVRHALVLDTFADVDKASQFEGAVSVAASFACTIKTQDSLLDLMFVGTKAYCCTAGRGLGDTDHLLEVLASVQLCADNSFDVLDQLVTEHMTGVSGCVCIFLQWDDRRRLLVQKLRAFGIPVLVLLMVGGDDEADANLLADDRQGFRIIEADKVEEGLAKL